jgi:hypothetical protein
MRRSSLRVTTLAILLLALVGCGDDSTGLEPATTIRVTLDWPTARQDGFLEARWYLQLIQNVEDEGTFSSNGTATLAYASQCREGSSSTGYMIQVSGRFEGADRPCWDFLMPVCTPEEQVILIDQPSGDCVPPSE